MFDMISHTLDGDLVLSDRQKESMEIVLAELDRLNAAIREAVDAGLSVELQRTKRYHSGAGCWGDVTKPVIVKCGTFDRRRMPQVSSSA